MDDTAWLNKLPCLMPQWKNAASKRNIFMPFVADVGGMGIDVTISDGNQLNVKSLKSKTSAVNFRAKVPCLPFMDANSTKSAEDACSRNLDNLRKKQETFLKYFRVYWIFARRNRHGDTFRSDLMELKKNIRSGNLSAEELVLPKKVKTLLKVKPKSMEDIPDHNSRYLKGCLTCTTLSSGKAVLVYPTGDEMDQLTVTPVELDSNEPLQWKGNIRDRFTLPFDGGRIYQISSSKSCYANKMFCAVRQKHKLSYHIFDVANEMPSLTSTYVVPEKKLFRCVEVNPYYEGELVYTKGSGLLVARDIATGNCICKMNLDTELMEQLWTVEYGAHPREVVCTSPKSIFYKDFRENKRLAAISDYPPTLNDYSFNLFSKQSPLNTMQQFVVAKNELFLLDRRYPSKVIHRWNHMLLSTPTMCDIVKLNKEAMYVVLVSSQTSHETCCIPLTNQEIAQPISQPLWHTSKSGDLLQTLTSLDIEGAGYQNRLMKPAIGACGVASNENNFTSFTLTSIGDLFGQAYFSDTNSLDKTFVPSFGLKDCEIGQETVCYLKNWLDTCPREPVQSKSCHHMLFYPENESLNIYEQMMNKSNPNDDFNADDTIDVEKNIRQFINSEASRNFELSLPSSIEEFDFNSSEDMFSKQVLRRYWPEKYK